MAIQPPDYDKVEMDLWRKHGTEVIDLLNNQDRGLMRRIRTFCARFNFNERDVCEKIVDDFMFACCFAKDAKKTGFEEKEAEKYLRMFPDKIRSIKTLPKSGKNAYYFDQNGNLIAGKKPTGIKSLDFTWMLGDTRVRCFAAHKVTRESGGAQDHQRNELINLLRIFKNSSNKDLAFFAICDGPYYDRKTLSLLRDHVRTEPPYSFACPISEVPENVDKLLAYYSK